jgi:hypothetical protein
MRKGRICLNKKDSRKKSKKIKKNKKEEGLHAWGGVRGERTIFLQYNKALGSYGATQGFREDIGTCCKICFFLDFPYKRKGLLSICC